MHDEVATARTDQAGGEHAASTQRELELREAALSAATNGIVIVDARLEDDPIVYVNAGFERMTGYASDEVLGRNCRFLQGPTPDEQGRTSFRRALDADAATIVRLRNFRKDGTPFWNEVSISLIRDGDGVVTHYVGVQTDVSERIAAEEQAAYLALCDPLTGLWNRRALGEELERRCTAARRRDEEVALLYLDLDDFKSVNDTRGHGAGDAMLLRVTERLQEVLPASAFLARQGGDEFSVVLGDDGDGPVVDRAMAVADAILAALRAPLLVGGEALATTASLGISVFPRDADSEAALQQHADTAMYAAKRAGGGSRRAFAHGGPALVPPVLPTDAAAAGPRVVGVDLEDVLAGGGVRSLYQPLVELDGARLVGYEALARGPRGTSLERPDHLFAAARERGLLAELEWACRAAALRGALEAGLPRHLSLFVNVEPSMLGASTPEHLRELIGDAADRLTVVFELTERALTDRPGDVLAAVPQLRRQGFGIALDDVGADPRSVALMPFLRPDVIKLDMHLVQDEPTAASASVVHAVRAEVERTGALLLAEGIENADHERTARSLGAWHGQGWAFGRPEPLPERFPQDAGAPLRLLSRTRAPATERTAFEVVREHVAPQTGTKRLLYSFSKHLEAQVTARSESAVLLATFQDARHFTPGTMARYRRFGQAAAFVGALGTDLPAEPVPGVRGASLRPDEPLRLEWNVVVVDPHFAAAFVARDLGEDAVDDWERRFTFCMTYDRGLAVEAARSLMRRVSPRAS